MKFLRMPNKAQIFKQASFKENVGDKENIDPNEAVKSP
jgi:hypothetical protein